MRDDIERFIAGDEDFSHLSDTPSPAEPPTDEAAELIGGPVLTCMADVEAREIDWLWPGRVPLGRITLLVGRPGEGKSFLTMDMAARVSTGTPWPDGTPCPQGSVLLVSVEDDPGDTIRWRLDAHRADCRRVHLLSAVRRIGEDGQPHDVMYTLEDVAALEDALRRLPDCRLIVVDPIGSFLGGSTDAHRDNEVRGVLAPVARLAEKYGPAVVVVAHRRKSAGTVADDLALGSRAFTGIARAVWHLSRDTDNKARRLLLPGKNNLAPEGDGLAFSIGGEPPAIIWEHEPVCMSADDGLAAENGAGDDRRPGPEPDARNGAAEWLRELLADGAMRVGSAKKPEPGSIAHAVADAGLSWGTVRRAREAIGIKPYKGQFGDGWYWRLPPAQGAHDDGEGMQGKTTCASSGEPEHLRDFQPKTVVYGLPDVPSMNGSAHLRGGPSNDKDLWRGNGEGVQDAQDDRGRHERGEP
jgi:putative DNA primase/helicase